MGPARTAGIGRSRIPKRIPRNAPGLWNLGHRSVTVMFHDGRLEVSDIYGRGFDTPAQEWLPEGLPNPLAAQALFPLVAQFEMAGNPSENEVAGAVHDRVDAAWPILARRVRGIPAYAAMFADAFDEVAAPQDVTIVHIAEALSDFINAEWQSHDSPWDRWRAGGPALPAGAARGAQLFFGRAHCASCHSGPLFTDQGFHAIGLPGFGPGRTRAFDPMPRDAGRIAASDRLEDAYRFRTPSLRNVALTAPYGHNGAYPTLREIVAHHADPDAALAAWTPLSANLPAAPWLAATDFAIRDDRTEMARQGAARDLPEVALAPGDIDDLVAFLESLTETDARRRPMGRPLAVPSGLPVD